MAWEDLEIFESPILSQYTLWHRTLNGYQLGGLERSPKQPSSGAGWIRRPAFIYKIYAVLAFQSIMCSIWAGFNVDILDIE